MPRRILSAVLAAALVVASWGPACARAAAAGLETADAAGAGAPHPFFPPAPPAWTAALGGFSAWSVSPAGRKTLASVDPALAALPARGAAAAVVAQPLLARATAGMSAEQSAAFLDKLARAAELPADERRELASALAAARRAAAADVVERLGRWGADLRAGGASAAPPAGGWQAALGFFGDDAKAAARDAARELSAAKAERARKMVQPFALDALKGALDAEDLAAAKTELHRAHPVDLAARWGDLEPGHRKIIIRLLPAHKASQTFEELERPHQEELIHSLEHEHVGDLVRGLDPAAAGRVARDLPPAAVERFLKVMRESDREVVERFSRYPERTVGSMMRGSFVTVDAEWTAQRALDAVRLSTRLRRVEETHLDSLMVVDEAGRLRGAVALKVLVAAPGTLKVGELMDAAPRVLSPLDKPQEAVNVFTRYKLRSAPIVEPDGVVVGVLRARDVLGAAREEAEDDFALMSGGKPGLLSRSALSITGVRLPWLIATCLGELLVSVVVKHYEPTLAHIVALATFIPLISAMGGNVGSQTATVVVRGLATGEVEREGAARVVSKEIAVGLLLGGIYGLVIAGAAYGLYGSEYGWKFAAVVGFAMSASMTAAATAGSLEPFLFKKLGIDPATATGPLITTFTDLVSTLVYFSAATLLLLR